jgi:hypothetical protein
MLTIPRILSIVLLGIKKRSKRINLKVDVLTKFNVSAVLFDVKHAMNMDNSSYNVDQF